MSGVADGLFGLTVHPYEERMCVALAGELDLAGAGRIEPEVIALLESGCPVVDIDLRALEFIDSSGIHELLRCRDHAAARSVPLRLLLAPGAVHRALSICRVLDYFDVEMED